MPLALFVARKARVMHAAAAQRIRSLIWLFVLVIASAAPVAADSSLRATDFKMAGNATEMRVVLHFDREPDPKWFLLRGPHRLVIDLPETSFVIDPTSLSPRGLIKNVRFGALDQGKSRLILTAKGPFSVDKVDVMPEEGGQGYRLVADISAASDRKFDQALADQSLTTASTDKGDRLGKPVALPAKRFTVVIDAGHGGIDGGAEGASGTVEKAITLSFAQELQKQLAGTGKYDVFMTRDTDVFLPLDERVRIARQHEADLFISIHADTISLKGIRGATVYTVSDKASDAEAQATADRENLSDTLAGIDIKQENHEVSDILVDLIRRETHTFSVRFARALVEELSPAVELINHPHRSAGFRVLKAPDVPSVLVELGYLSNPKDETQLRDPDWRSRAADRIASAIAAFAATKTATGG
ncbi:N-acetylmuramoyl-L-alanine amidase [Mesorhizobium sp. BAC0120]|uniref:N-acetylmuramoyl-L-alanine amidase n=1 Tax=Mesorhizobium sp. BAC0120 TaxID=3090670 RepID=UPI00399ADC4B